MRARGSETGSIFHERVWLPPGGGETLVDPISWRSSQVGLTEIVDSVMGPSREDSPTHGLGDERGKSLEECQLLYYLPVLLLLH
jgi:hypothetical protein